MIGIILITGIVVGLNQQNQVCAAYTIVNGLDPHIPQGMTAEDEILDLMGSGTVVVIWYDSETGTHTGTCSAPVSVSVGTWATKLRLLPEKVYIRKDGTFSIDVEIEDVERLNRLQIRLLFDPSKIQVIGTPTKGTFMGGGDFLVPPVYDNTDGIVEFTDGIFEGGSKTGTGILATIKFKSMVDDPTSVLTFDFGYCKLRNPVSEQIPVLNENMFPAYINPEYYFDIEIPGHIIAGRSCKLIVTAKKAALKIDNEYTGTPTITSSGTLTPSVITGFTNGVATCLMKLYEVGTITITITDTDNPLMKGTTATRVTWLCDFGSWGFIEGNYDDLIDIGDLAGFVRYWNIKNWGYLGGQGWEPGDTVGPGTISPPYIDREPDGFIDVDDLGAFIVMWDWRNYGIIPQATYIQPQIESDAPASATVRVAPNEITTQLDGTFTVGLDVELNEGISLGVNGIRLRFDAEKLEVVGEIEKGALVGGGSWMISPTVDNKAGYIEITDAIFGTSVTGSGTLAMILFRCKMEGEGTTSLSLEDVKFADSGGAVIGVMIENGLITLPPPLQDRICGLVTDLLGTPLEDAWIEVWDGNKLVTSTSTFAAQDIPQLGQVNYITDPLPGTEGTTYTIKALKSRYMTEFQSSSEEQKVDFILYSPIQGKVTDTTYSSGRGIKGVQITVEDEKTHMSTQTVTSIDGTYLFKLLVGTYTIRASMKGYLSEGAERTNILSGTGTALSCDFSFVQIPTQFITYAYPNPFDMTQAGYTTIKSHLPIDGEVIIKIYTITGELVKTLVNECRNAGIYRDHWDGTNIEGQKVASGVYLYVINAGTKTKVEKIAVLK